MITKYRKFKRPSKTSLFFHPYLRKVFFVFFGVLISIIIGHLIISNFKINKKRAELDSRMDAIKQEISVLEKRNKELKAQILWTSEQEHLEKQARERLNLKKPGEKVVTIVPQKEQESKEFSETIKPKSWWQKILEKLGF
ncbi:septum formation initiator family protein [Candidatus Parcubacteria bacterium]|nr:septum formation initiator family protein [Candidatus Parcubacteria bacterium]